MKKLIMIALISVAAMCLCTGCGGNEVVSKGVPVSGNGSTIVWRTIEEAEDIVGFAFNLPDTIGRKYKQTEIRTMGRQMIEVDYCKGDTVVCVTKQRGGVTDLYADHMGDIHSGEAEHIGTTVSVFETYPDGVKIYIEDKEYTWTVIAPTGLKDKEYRAFVDEIGK